MKQLFILIFLIVFFISCGTGFQKEKESNDTIGEANIITVSKAVKGYIQSATDTDFYKLQVDTESTCEINLSAVKGVNLAIKVWSGESTPLVVKFIDDTRKSSPEHMANLHLKPGTYYFQVLHGVRDKKKKNTETPYILKLKTQISAEEEKEPNDVANDATKLQVGSEIKGFFSPAYNHNNYSKSGKLIEEDWYVLDVKLEDGNAKLLSVNLSGVVGINSTISLYDNNNNLIKVVDGNPAGGDESIKAIGIVKDTTFFIKVNGKGYNSNNITPYYLSATLIDYDPTMEMEPNNTFERSNEMKGSLVKGQLNDPGDSDLFLKKTENEGYYTIRVSAPENCDIMFVIYSKTMKKLFQVNNGRKNVSEILPNFYLNGPVYIRVKSKNSVEKNDGIYELTIEKNDISGLYDLEPNDSIQKAVLVRSKVIKGYTSYKKDKDFYFIKSESRGKKIVNITAPKNGSIVVSLTDPFGNTMQSITVSQGKSVILDEMFDMKNYILVESKSEDYENHYILNFGE